MEIPDEIADWAIDWRRNWDEAMYPVCEFATFSEHPDRRHKSGMRTERHACGEWLDTGDGTIRDIVTAVTAHVQMAHRSVT